MNEHSAIEGVKVGSFEHVLKKAHEDKDASFYKMSTAKNYEVNHAMRETIKTAVANNLEPKLPMDANVLQTKFQTIVGKELQGLCSPSDSEKVLDVAPFRNDIKAKNEAAKTHFVDDAVVAFDKGMVKAGHAQVDCTGRDVSKCTFHQLPGKADFLNYMSLTEFLNSEEKGKQLVDDARTDALSKLTAAKSDAGDLLLTVKETLYKREADATAQHIAHHLLVVQVQFGTLLAVVLIYCGCVSRRGRSSGLCRRCAPGGGDNPIGCEGAGSPSKYGGKRTKFFV